MAEDQAREDVGFWRRFRALFGLGLVGVLGLLPIAVPAARQQIATNPAIEMPVAAFVALTMINPVVLLAIAVAAGLRLSDRVGLRSHLDQRARGGPPVLSRLRPELPVALLAGAGGGTILVLGDLALAPWVSAGAPELDLLQDRSLGMTVAGMLYGGIAEELMLRWGLMTFLAWVAWRVAGRRSPVPGPGAMWGAILGAAIAFGAGHLPALAAMVPLTGPLIVRTVLLNALGGIFFGWLYWRHSLEAAMVSHATFHVVFTAFALLA